MKRYLFLLAALAFVVLAGPAEAAARFAICSGTCTWDNTSTAMWATTSGGATGASAPTASDDVTMDGNTCVGGTTCTITTFAGTISVRSITWGACTASTTGCIIDASANNTNFTISGGTIPFNGSGTGTRKWLAGTGAYMLTQSIGNSPFTMATTTNDQGTVFSGATWIVNGTTTGTRSWQGGGFSFGPTTFSANSSGGSMLLTGTNTFSSLTVAAPNSLQIGGTQTISGALAVTGGSSSAQTLITSNSLDSPQTVSLGSASSGSWVGLRAITTSGAAALTLTSSFDLGRNTLANGGSISPPSGGGGSCPGRVIGG